MQTPPSQSLPPMAYALMALATVFGATISSLVTNLLNRRKQSADTDLTKAQTVKTQAESRQIDSAILSRAYDRIEDFKVIVGDKNIEIIDLQRDKARLDWELDLAKQREKIYVEELRVLKAEVQML